MGFKRNSTRSLDGKESHKRSKNGTDVKMTPSDRDFSVGDEEDLLAKGGVFIGTKGRNGMPGKNLLNTAEPVTRSIEMSGKKVKVPDSGPNSYLSNSGSAAQGAVVSREIMTLE